MAASKLLNLLALTSLAVLATTFNAQPVTALSHAGGSPHLNRIVPGGHQAIAKKRRGTNGRCKQRSSSSIAAAAQTPAAAIAVSVGISVGAAAPATTSVAAAPTTSAAPAPSSTPAPVNSAGKGKIGISWNSENDPSSLGNVVSDNTGYVYTWSPWAPSDNLFGLQFAAMLWGPTQQSPWDQLVVPGYTNIALALNEPDEPSQLNMDPGAAATFWQQQVNPRAGMGYDIWGPAVTSSARGETWMDNFLAACAGACTFSHNSLHFYDTDPQALITYVEHWHQKYGKPIVLTEFACQNFGGGAQADMDQVWAFYQTVIPWLMAQDYVTAIIPFGFLEDMGNVNPLNQLMKGGQLTDLGKYVVYGPY
ncbi:glycoside hydrolase family 128 protein [Phanerochaete sordida]|uniref:Glycoside hydrolase family 128 protein n=1 Tax=Phanerochaete sordida TaxID=48140 RepID=A0A9P3FYT0_9APHY|nr:glycoside hydrolase family 128 protein [Phanerochaete sordida]